MSHTYVSCLLHCVWSTKNRQPLITPEIAERLYHYIAGIAKQLNPPLKRWAIIGCPYGTIR